MFRVVTRSSGVLRLTIFSSVQFTRYRRWLLQLPPRHLGGGAQCAYGFTLCPRPPGILVEKHRVRKLPLQLETFEPVRRQCAAADRNDESLAAKVGDLVRVSHRVRVRVRLGLRLALA